MSDLQFKREMFNDKRHWVATLPNGAKVVKFKRDADMDVYDAKGRWLGISGKDDEAADAAETGCVLDIRREAAGDLSLWVLWNDAVASGVDVLMDIDNEAVQVLALPDDIYMLVEPESDGWSVTLLCGQQVIEQFWSVDKSRWNLRICDNPFRLE